MTVGFKSEFVLPKDTRNSIILEQSFNQTPSLAYYIIKTTCTRL